ncbi:A/G-specific adenine glycosylase [Thioalkalivibrio sp.]|uniref:A/G-specific adenine glycosylase n=1 Tax=Thioalkalivibrio sp. TaxID=2093813 RepID=UPI003974840C
MSLFAARLLSWFDRHGRHDLPWQHPRSAYRVWISEIMLQQTRVEAVIPYFQAFMARLPDVRALAGAPLDEVLHLWSGLGYYARARNLHRAARLVQERHGGELPAERAALEALPGIGRSTAAAILAQAHGQPEAILDGNVRRVLARHAAVEGWPGSTAVQSRLWELAEARLPRERMGDYTQAIMDLGATVCRRTQPACQRCPVASDCAALAQGRTSDLPTPRPGRALPLRTRWAALVIAPAGVYLERREPAGIWGGLYSMPEAEQPEDLRDAVLSRWTHAREEARNTGDRIAHVFSHYRLDLRILRFRLPAAACGIMEGGGSIWYNSRLPVRVGLPAPIERFLKDQGTIDNGANR